MDLMKHLGQKITCGTIVMALFLGVDSLPAYEVDHDNHVECEGVVVESISMDEKSSPADILEGDWITGWAQGKESGSIKSIYDWNWLLQNRFPRGPVTLHVRREKTVVPPVIIESDHNLRVRPCLKTEQVGTYMTVFNLVANQNYEPAATVYISLAEGLPDNPSACWFLVRAGELLVNLGMSEKAIEIIDRAVGIAEKSENIRVPAYVLFRSGMAFSDLNLLDKASGTFDRLAGKLAGKEDQRLFLSSVWLEQGKVSYFMGDLDGALEYWKNTLEVRKTDIPGTLLHSDILNNIGIIHDIKGDLETARQLYTNALRIRETIDPEGIPVAQSYNNLGIVARAEGNFRLAEQHYARALAIHEKRSAGSVYHANALMNLGVVQTHRGDLDWAEQLYMKAYEMLLKIDPEGIDTAVCLGNLADIAYTRVDYDRAASYFGQTLSLLEKAIPDSYETAIAHNNMGVFLQSTGDLEGAGEHFSRALEIYRKISQRSRAIADTLNNLGLVMADRGNLQAALDYHLKALDIEQELVPGGTQVAGTHLLAGLANIELGKMDEAEEQLQKALTIFNRLAPGSKLEAETCHALGRISKGKGNIGEALSYFTRAVESLDRQMDKLGGGKSAGEKFSSKYADYYRDRIDLLILKGDKKEAFHALESFRARSLLAMLAERELDWSGEAPVELLEESRVIAMKFQAVRNTMESLNPKEDAGRLEELHKELAALHVQKRENEKAVGLASPKLAELQYPHPLDLEETQNLLKPGTLFLSYCVCRDKVYLFSILNHDLRVDTIPVEREAFTRNIRYFMGFTGRGTENKIDMIQLGGKLYATLLKPVEDRIQKAEIILLSPDGPLHLVPFAALVTSEGHYLTEIKPLIYTLSATVYDEISGYSDNAKEGPVVLFGDPQYPRNHHHEDPVVGSILRRSGLDPLPASRDEVLTIAGLFKKRSRVYLGKEATEEKVLQLPRRMAMVHFACHGVLDERFPLNSGLALSIPEKQGESEENGILQVWEIFESVRFDADLVTLSACKTALGEEMGGEGLIGLTRAFQYAGARSVLSTLWSVPDLSTAEFMESFYGYVGKGHSKASALQKAQIDFINKGSALSHPSVWAAFVLNGQP